MRRDQSRRALVLLTVLLALAVGARHVVKRGMLGGTSARSTDKGPSQVASTPEPGDRTAWVELARRILDGEVPATDSLEGSSESVAVVISLSRSQAAALVTQGLGGDTESAVATAAARLRERSSSEERASGRLKIDSVQSIGTAMDLGEPLSIERSLQGLWLPNLELLLLPEELEARRLVDSKGLFRSDRLAEYLAEGGRDLRSDAPPEALRRAHWVELESLAEGPRGSGGTATPPIRLYRGNDRSPDLSPEALLDAALRGGEYLRRHQEADGSFDYAYAPKRDEVDDDDNLLRRAGTCYSLIELHRAAPAETQGEFGQPTFLEVARRGLAALLDRHTQAVALPGMEPSVEAVISPGDELKLGGSALLALALVEYQNVSGDSGWLPRVQNLARFLVSQQEEDGHFVSKISLEGRRFDFESGYYPGEAILALTRLHRLDGDPRWLEVARRGADWLIQVRDGDKTTAELAHDHWLLMALDALDELSGDEVYGQHAGRIAQAILDAQRKTAPHLDWVGSFYDPPRSTPTATRAEALVAMHRLARRQGRATRPYLESLLRMAAFQRRCQLDEVSAMYLPRPDLAVGGFRRGLTHFEIRIDYVQHNVSALLGVRAILLDGSD